MRIGGIYEANALLGSFLVGDAFFLSHFSVPLPIAVLLQTSAVLWSSSASPAALRGYPNLKIQTRAQFEQSQRSPGEPACSASSTPCSRSPC